MGLHSSNSHSSKGCRKAFKAQCIHTCLNLIQSQMHLIDEHANASLEAAMLPTRKALTHFTLNGAASSALKKHAKRLLTDIDGAVGESISSRVAPVCADVVQKNPKKLLNPKFEVDFDKRRDYDPDRERAEYKQYKRMAAKEKRGKHLWLAPWFESVHRAFKPPACSFIFMSCPGNVSAQTLPVQLPILCV